MPMPHRPRILLTGAAGQVGFELQRQLAVLGLVDAPDRQTLNLADAQAVAAWLRATQPALIVNAAAYTAVDRAESEAALADRLNAQLPAQLAAYTAERDAWLVHYSSDYVYPGDGDTAWSEDAATGPLSVYGRSKRDGDAAVQASGSRHLILRTSWVYSARGHNFMKTMLRLGREREQLRVVSDQIGAPTPARLLAQITALALWRNLSGTAPLDSGIYHLAPNGFTSWQGFACAIFAQAKALGVPLAVVPEQVLPILTTDYPTPARRPLNSRLQLDKLQDALGIQLPDWQDQLRLTLAEYVSTAASG